MPWRNFVNDEFETATTTDMSTAKLESMLNEGWTEATVLEMELARLLRGYGKAATRKALAKLTKDTNAPPIS